MTSVDGTLTVAVVPVTGQLDLKALAHAAGGKKAAMARQARRRARHRLRRRRHLPARPARRAPHVIDETAWLFDTVFVSGGPTRARRRAVPGRPGPPHRRDRRGHRARLMATWEDVAGGGPRAARDDPGPHTWSVRGKLDRARSARCGPPTSRRSATGPDGADPAGAHRGPRHQGRDARPAPDATSSRRTSTGIPRCSSGSTSSTSRSCPTRSWRRGCGGPARSPSSGSRSTRTVSTARRPPSSGPTGRSACPAAPARSAPSSSWPAPAGSR